MNLGKINVRFIDAKDVPALERYRNAYLEGDLEIPHGYNGAPGRGDKVQTVVSENDEGKLVSSLTGIYSLILDPFIHAPNAKPEEIAVSLVKMETVLSCLAQVDGAVDIYIAVPSQLTAYHRLLERHGYSETVQNCKVFRKPLRPDHVPLIGPQRDRG